MASSKRCLRRDTGDIQHAAGSCRMAGFNDANGVVNPDGTVKGIAGLRVADASIMPSDCRANTHFTTVVIGEAIARMMMRKADVSEQRRRHGAVTTESKPRPAWNGRNPAKGEQRAFFAYGRRQFAQRVGPAGIPLASR